MAVWAEPTDVLLRTRAFFFVAESSSAMISHPTASSYHSPSGSKAYCGSSIGSQDGAKSQARSAVCRGIRSPGILSDSVPIRLTLPSDAWTTEKSSENGIGSWKAPPKRARFGGRWDINASRFTVYRGLINRIVRNSPKS